MGRSSAILLLVAVVILPLRPVSGRAAADRTPEVLVLGASMDVAVAVLAGRDAAVGWGVFPGTRASAAFLEEMTAGSPWRRGVSRDTGGRLGLVLQILADRCVEVDNPPRQDHPASWVHSGFNFLVSPARPCETPTGTLRVRLADSATEAAGLIGSGEGTTIVIGVADRTPVLFAMLGTDGILTPEGSNRRGVLTPYDVSATVLDLFGIDRPSSVIGTPVRAHPAAEPFEELEAIGARMERDAGFGPGLTGVTAGLGIAAVVASAFALWRRRARLAGMLARAAAAAPAGYLAGVFVPSSSWAVRSSAVVAASAIGASRRGAATRRACGVVFVTTAAVVALLTLAAAARPHGEPALSLWGDPLTSWRFFGLRNHLAAFVAGGAIVGVALLRARPRAYVAVGVAAAAVVGAPGLGANFIGVLTLVFGASAGVLLLWRKRAEIWQPLAAAAAAVGATALALLADAGSPVSHGGRAARTIDADGVSAAWAIFRQRAQLNYREIADLGAAGYLAFIAATLVGVGLFVWAWRARGARLDVRAAVLGGAAAGLAALYVEDSGFFTGGILLLYPAIAYLAAAVAPAEQPDRDGGHQDRQHDDRRERE